MIYLIGGENTFESKKALDKLISEYVEKGVSIRKAYVSDTEVFQNALAGTENFGLFGGTDKKFLVIYGFDEAKKDEEEKMMQIPAEQTDIVLYSRRNWDKRSKFYKYFNKSEKAKVVEYKLLQGREIDTWFSQYLREIGLKTDRWLLQELIFRIGNDQNILVSEAGKLLILQKEGIKITQEIFDEVIVDTQNVDIWDLIDVLKSNKVKAFKLLDYLNNNMEYEYIMSLFARQIRLIFLALNSQDRASLQLFGVHPFVAAKLISESRNYSLEKIKRLYEKIVNIDIGVKSGKLDKGLALDLLLVAF